MTRRRRLMGGMAWNLIGNVMPLVAAVAAIPMLISRMGPSRFGLLTFVWMIVGYSALLDLGVGRALTHGVAERLGRRDVEEIPAVVRAGVGSLLLIGLVGFLVLTLGSAWVAGRFLKVPADVVLEAERSLKVAALVIPMVVLASAFRGVLEGYQRFRVLGVVRSVAGVLLFVSPVIVLQFTGRLWVVVGALAAVRLLELGCYVVYTARLIPGLMGGGGGGGALLRRLFRFGIWSTLNNLVGGLMSMAYIDRVYISGTLGTDALAFFATPFDMVAKVLIAPAAMIGVLFPEFSSLGHQASDRARVVAMQAIRVIVFGTAPVFLLFIGAADPLLTLWLGAEVAAQSRTTFQIVSVGTLAVSVAYVPFAFIQAMGRPDLTAKRHFLEIPFYAVASYAALRMLGTTGSSLVWSVWAVVDLILIGRIMRRVVPSETPTIEPAGWVAVSAFLGVAYLCGISGVSWLQISAGVVTPGLFVLWGWSRWLEPEDRLVIAAWAPATFRQRLSGRGG